MLMRSVFVSRGFVSRGVLSPSFLQRRRAAAWRVMRPGLLFAAHRRGVATLEFAVIAPVLLMMTIGALDVGRAVIVWQEVQTAAQNIAMSAAALAGPSTGEVPTDSDLSTTNATEAMTAIYGVIPESKSTSYTGVYSVTLSGVVYQTVGTTTTAYIIWSVPLPLVEGTTAMQQPTRACGQMTEITGLPETPATMNTLPTANVTAKSPYIIADVHYQYKPFFFWYVTGNIDFWESYIWFPLIGNSTGPTPQQITFDKQSSSDTYVCQNQPPPA